MVRTLDHLEDHAPQTVKPLADAVTGLTDALQWRLEVLLDDGTGLFERCRHEHDVVDSEQSGIGGELHGIGHRDVDGEVSTGRHHTVETPGDDPLASVARRRIDGHRHGTGHTVPTATDIGGATEAQSHPTSRVVSDDHLQQSGQPRPMFGRLPWLALERRSLALRFFVFLDIGARS